jgi:hypothetical protein
MAKRLFVALVSAGGILLLALLYNGSTNASQWGVVWSEEFKGTSVPDSWDVFKQNKDNYGNNHLAYNPSNVKVVNNDYLEIKTQRHCVANLDEPLNDSNASETPCPSGKMTRYLSGRVTNKTKVVDGTKPFRAEIRAKFNWNGKNGTRPSLWMVNGVSLKNCNDNPNANDPYGELDIIEWYSYTPAYTWSSTHATCYHHGVSGNWKNGWRTRRIIHSDEHRAGSKPGTLAYEWHTWAVEYDGETVKYFVDNKPITAYHYHASPTDSKEIERTPAAPLTKLADASLIKRTFDEGWRFILNDYVEADADQKPISPSDSFPKQTMLIDYVRVFQKGAGTQPAETPVPKTGATWSKRDAAGSQNWSSIAGSTDGSKLVAAAWGGKIHTSSDAGANWTEHPGAGDRNWLAVASSADGNKLAALYDWGGYIFTSSDAGANWTARGVPGSHNWTAIASSADGNRLVAVAKDSTVFTSSDAGVTWTAQANSGSRKWSAVASSADGNKLVATVEDDTVFTSSDAGVTWTAQANSGSRKWSAVASSADGNKLVATATGGRIYTSANAGATWTERAADGLHNWTAVTISDDGQKLSATAGGGGYIYSSNDGGATWVAQTSAGVPNWAAIASSADGSKIAAAAYGGAIYTTANNAPVGPSEEEQKVTAAEAAVANAESTKRPSDVAAAKTKVDVVGDAGKKAAFQARLDAVTNAISGARSTLTALIAKAKDPATVAGMSSSTIAALQAQVTAAEAVINNANASVSELDNARTALQGKLDALKIDKASLQAAITAAEATPSYIKSDPTVASALAAAKAVLNQANPSASDLQSAIANLNSAVASAKQKEQDAQDAAQAAVTKAEADKTQSAVDAAKVLVGKVQDPAKKAALQAKLNAVVVKPAPTPTTPTTSATVAQSGGGTVTVATAGTQCYNIASAAVAAAPNDYDGRVLRDIVGFTINCTTGQTAKVGYTTRVTLTLSKYYADHSQLAVAKISNGAIKEDITSRVTFGTIADGKHTTVTYDLTDGGFGDEDKAANGTIVDPVGVYERQQQTNPGVGGGTGNPVSPTNPGGATTNGTGKNTQATNKGGYLADTGASVIAVTVVAVVAGGAGVWFIRKKM